MLPDRLGTARTGQGKVLFSYRNMIWNFVADTEPPPHTIFVRAALRGRWGGRPPPRGDRFSAPQFAGSKSPTTSVRQSLFVGDEGTGPVQDRCHAPKAERRLWVMDVAEQANVVAFSHVWSAITQLRSSVDCEAAPGPLCTLQAY